MLFAACFAALTSVALAQTGQQRAPLRCDVGPVSQDIGGSSWLSYACEDAKSLVVVSDTSKGNPVFFYFVFYPKADGTYGLTGEGNGDQTVTKPVFDILKLWGPEEISSQIQQARSVARR